MLAVDGDRARAAAAEALQAAVGRPGEEGDGAVGLTAAAGDFTEQVGAARRTLHVENGTVVGVLPGADEGLRPGDAREGRLVGRHRSRHRTSPVRAGDDGMRRVRQNPPTGSESYPSGRRITRSAPQRVAGMHYQGMERRIDGSRPAAVTPVPPHPRAEGLDDAERLRSVAATGLGAAADPTFDRFSRLVRRLLDVPAALVSLVDDHRQVLPGAVGLAAPWGEARETPLSHSMCQHVVLQGEPLVIQDAREEQELRDSLAIPDLGVIAYMGVPLTDVQGRVLGSLCAIDSRPRIWTSDEMQSLHDLAEVCSTELRLRIAADSAGQSLLEASEARRAAELARSSAQNASRAALAAQRRAESLVARLKLIGAVTQATSVTFDAVEAMERLARLVLRDLADWCVVDQLNAPETVTRVAIAHHDPAVSLTTTPHLLPRLPDRDGDGSLVRVLRGQDRLVVLGPAELAVEEALSGTDPLTAEQQDLFGRLGGRHAVVLPIRTRQRVLGALTLVRVRDEPFDEADLLLAAEVAGRAAVALDNARRYEVQRRAARTLQAALTPDLPALESVTVAGRYLPSEEGVDVGGDWFDAFARPRGGTMVMLGDVVGHDLHAAVKMGQLRAMLRAVAYDSDASPAEVLSKVDAATIGLHAELMATTIFGAIEPDPAAPSGWCWRWSNAGHLPPLLVSADGSSTLLDAPADLMLGVDATSPRSDSSVPLVAGDTVLLYTDGLVESRDAGLDVGIARLRKVVAGTVPGSAQELCDTVFAALVGSRAADDTAVLAIRIQS